MANIFLKPEKPLSCSEEFEIFEKEFQIAINDFSRNSEFENKYFNETTNTSLREFFESYDLFMEKISLSLNKRLKDNVNTVDIEELKNDEVVLDYDIEKTETNYNNSKIEGKRLIKRILHGDADKEDVENYCKKYDHIIVDDRDVIIPAIVVYAFIRRNRLKDRDHQELYRDIEQKRDGGDVDNNKMIDTVLRVMAQNAKDFGKILTVTKQELDKKHAGEPSMEEKVDDISIESTITKLNSYHKKKGSNNE